MALRILIVDDSTIFRKYLRQTLESHVGWEVCGEAVDGMDGIEKNRSLIPQLILMDFSMPRMTGLESAAAILKEFPGVLIVLLTLYPTDQLQHAAQNVGIRATVAKADMRGLATDIGQALGGSPRSSGTCPC